MIIILGLLCWPAAATSYDLNIRANMIADVTFAETPLCRVTALGGATGGATSCLFRASNR